MMQEIMDPAITLFGKKIRFPTEEASQQKDTQILDKNSQPTAVNSSSGSDEDLPPDTVSDSGNVTPGTPSVGEETETGTKATGDENEKSLLKKPDKIIPCPRCSSMDTKFCYYNNYNVNQPRHFCKACQRYWTAGGTMRNVPVGAGRRKNKHYRHLTISDTLRADQIDAGVGADGVLSFGFDSAAANAKPPTGDECSSASNSAETVACIPGVPWPSYPPFCPPPGFPMPFYPYWPSAGALPAGAWNMPWLTAPPPIYCPTNTESTSPGKRTREGEAVGPEAESPSGRRHGGVLVPKTLRFDDPNEAAKSSIWATLGIENGGAGTFRAFRGTSDVEKKAKSSGVEASLAQRANPAAMCRSVNFHESS